MIKQLLSRKNVLAVAFNVMAMALFLNISPVLAAPGWAPTTATGHSSLDTFIQTSLNAVTVVAAVVAVVYLIINGIKYITSQGDSNTMEQAQKGIIAALIGLAIIGGAYLIVQFVVKNILKSDVSDLSTI